MDMFVLLLQILLINIVLSGDNAVVIALASKNLPAEQRKKAIWWGAFGAIALRIVLTFAAVFLLKVPFIQIVGAVLLMYIAIKLLVDDESHTDVKAATTLFAAVWTIILADFIMSLDNVIAVAAIAKDNYLVLILGIALSIPLIIWGSNLIMKLLHQYPVFVYVGAGILGFAAGEMLTGDEKVEHFIENGRQYLHWVIPAAFTAVVLLSGLVKKWRAPKSA